MVWILGLEAGFFLPQFFLTTLEISLSLLQEHWNFLQLSFEIIVIVFHGGCRNCAIRKTLNLLGAAACQVSPQGLFFGNKPTKDFLRARERYELMFPRGMHTEVPVQLLLVVRSNVVMDSCQSITPK
jgi:hypothetical protein